MFSGHVSSKSVQQFNSPFPGTPHPKYGFIIEYMKNPTGDGGEAAGYFYKNSNQIFKKPDPSA